MHLHFRLGHVVHELLKDVAQHIKPEDLEKFEKKGDAALHKILDMTLGAGEHGLHSVVDKIRETAAKEAQED